MQTPRPPLDVTTVFPELAGRGQVTVRLHPRPTPDLPLDVSKLGGIFLWPADESWPRCTELEEPAPTMYLGRLNTLSAEDAAIPDDIPVGHALHNDNLVGILQLRQADVPELGFYPDTDLFQLLWCPRSHPDQYAPFCRVFWRRAADVTTPLPQTPAPSLPDDDLLPVQCAITPEQVIEYSSVPELDETLADRIRAWEDSGTAGGLSYQYQLSVAPGTKVGGYVGWHNQPDWPACPTCGEIMGYLMTIASGEGGGTPEADARWYGSGQVGDSYLSIGGGNQLTIFICRRHDDWPIAWIHQA